MKKLHFTKPDTPINEYCIALRDGNSHFNHPASNETQRQRIAAYVNDDGGTMVAGVIAEVRAGVLYIEDLWVSRPVRHCGVGSRLLDSFEDYARTHGITELRLQTTSVQAVAFYRSRGYRATGETGEPEGVYNLRKSLKH
ncbi:GNAT family N-acetyltransferase [Exilibacterium tricleocarpae]|uniref:GNAT family N-acetyltransferase n=1 Tax=Exilibacterium tricleocarpae TaxID=2591008 RepID=A0A545TK86_9GAMM|nr:GNAT family N-acetyltransferase [Exilibacterium tricleocarpae]TQV77639.1 GNAT family N-acetyltransferase [Exilibacterium tricleocarpae]